MSDNTSSTRRGRPPKKKDAAASQASPASTTTEASIQTPVEKTNSVVEVSTPKTKKFKVKRQEDPNVIKEYKLTKKSGATFLMQQKNVMTMTEEGELREIRYCPNEPSIFRDEQNKASTRKAVVFTEGRIFVTPKEPNLSAYLDAHPDNVDNGGNRFSLVDNSKDSEKKLTEEFLEHDAISLIRTKDIDELLSVAVGLSINVNRPVAEIKHDLMVHAKKNPQRFIQSFDNPMVKMKSMLSQAADYQIIKVDKRGVFWYDSNKLIVSVPEGKDPIDIMVRFCLTESAVSLVQEIERQLENS